MNPDRYMLFFGLAFIAVMFAMILIPFLRRRADLMTPWTFFLGGSAIYVGWAAVDVAIKPHYERLPWLTSPTMDDYMGFIFGTLAFFIPLFIAFYLLKRPGQKVAKKVNLKWPPISINILAFISLVAAVVSLGVVFRPNIPVIAQIVGLIGNKAMPLAICCAFVAWFYDRTNPVWFMILTGLLIYGLLLSVTVGSGRRTLMSTILAVPIAYYWIRLRYKNPMYTLTVIGAVGVLALVFVAAYSTVRHRGQNEGMSRSFSYSLESLMMVPSRLGEMPTDQMFGQRAVEFSMLCRNIYGRANLPTRPFHSLICVFSNPVPRGLWPNKPEGLGATLPKDVHARTRASWGPGIVGHGYHDGGLLVLAIYGVLMGFFLRCLNEYLVQASNNPFMIGVFVGISPHIFGWTRGDISTFSIQIIAGIITGVLLAVFGRFLFGTANPRRVVHYASQLPQTKQAPKRPAWQTH